MLIIISPINKDQYRTHNQQRTVQNCFGEGNIWEIRGGRSRSIDNTKIEKK